MPDRGKPTRIRRKPRWKRILLALLLFGLVSAWGASTFFRPESDGRNNAGETASQPLNILVLGLVDEKHPNSDSLSNPSDTIILDTIMLVSVSARNSQIGFLSLPRDTRVNIPGHGMDKLGNAYAYGGTGLVIRTVSDFTGLPISYYLTINWQGFVDIVNILGGVDLYVDKDMNYEDPRSGLKISLTKGFQHLDGEKAGEYVRYQNDDLGDIGRIQRQQRLVKVLSQEAFKLANVIKFPAILATIGEHVDTNIPLSLLVKEARDMKANLPGQVKTEMLPGNFATINGLSYWIPDQAQAKQVVAEILGRSTKCQ